MENELDGVSCVDSGRIFELISTAGHHCDVWRASGVKVSSQRRKRYDLVVKKYNRPCTLREIQVLDREYRRLKSELEDIVPNAVYVATRDERRQLIPVVVAVAVNRWFNIANPANEDEAVPLLQHLPKARNQLLRFVHAARKFQHERNAKTIDLYGLDNLVLNTKRELRYLDSFHVYFYMDMLEIFEEEDELLRRKIEVSMRRQEYLEHLLAAANREIGG